MRTAENAEEAWNILRQESIMVMFIDIGLPDADGRDVCLAMRAAGVTVPVLFLTARSRLPDRLAGFSADKFSAATIFTITGIFLLTCCLAWLIPYRKTSVSIRESGYTSCHRCCSSRGRCCPFA